MANGKNIKCPKCGAEIDVNDVLYHQLDDELKKGYERRLSEEKGKMKEELENSLRLKIAAETDAQIGEMKKELDLKSEQVKELNLVKAEILKLSREKEELESSISLKKELEFTEKLKDEKAKIQKQVEDSNVLKIREKEKIIEALMGQLDEAKRKAEQGSMQLQGEVQELELENILREAYIYDAIEEIKNGAKGADVLQTVKTETGTVCGKIYYESKRTKEFQPAWLKKLRDDNLEVRADILVLATEAMPEGHTGYFYQEGVWICPFYEIRNFSLMLRFALFKMHEVSAIQHGRESKMEMLYNYLTSNEFKGQFGAILEGFAALQENHQKEKTRTQKMWAEREKQLDKILSSAANFYGSVKGIAGGAIPDIKMLEGGGEEELE